MSVVAVAPAMEFQPIDHAERGMGDTGFRLPVAAYQAGRRSKPLCPQARALMPGQPGMVCLGVRYSQLRLRSIAGAGACDVVSGAACRRWPRPADDPPPLGGESPPESSSDLHRRMTRPKRPEPRGRVDRPAAQWRCIAGPGPGLRRKPMRRHTLRVPGVPRNAPRSRSSLWSGIALTGRTYCAQPSAKPRFDLGPGRRLCSTSCQSGPSGPGSHPLQSEPGNRFGRSSPQRRAPEGPGTSGLTPRIVPGNVGQVVP